MGYAVGQEQSCHFDSATAEYVEVLERCGHSDLAIAAYEEAVPNSSSKHTDHGEVVDSTVEPAAAVDTAGTADLDSIDHVVAGPIAVLVEAVHSYCILGQVAGNSVVGCNHYTRPVDSPAGILAADNPVGNYCVEVAVRCGRLRHNDQRLGNRQDQILKNCNHLQP